MADFEGAPIGFIGLGIMGKPMARNLAKAGYDLVVYNRSRDDVDTLLAEGNQFQAAGSPREVAERTKAIITMLPDSPDVRDVVFGENGLLPAMDKGHLLVDMSTIAPATAVEVDAALRERGARALDAPVSGGDKGAIAGTLSIMVGGDAEDFQRAMPLFEAMGKTIVHVGGAGAGQIVKACNQVVVAINYAAVSEALVLGAKAGVDPGQDRAGALRRAGRQPGARAEGSDHGGASIRTGIPCRSAPEGSRHRAFHRRRELGSDTRDRRRQPALRSGGRGRQRRSRPQRAGDGLRGTCPIQHRRHGLAWRPR